jgi:phosphonopyruvate decarboxylase
VIAPKTFVDAAERAGFTLYTGVPCSYVRPFIDFVIGSPRLAYVGATNEGDAVAIASGAELGGRRAVAMMQNSGLGNAVSPLTSFNAIFGIPVLLVVTLRGEPGGPRDEPQHELMGAVTTKMLDLVGVGWSWFPRAEGEVATALERAVRHMDETGRPYALVMRKDSVSACDAALPRAAPAVAQTEIEGIEEPPGGAKLARPSREEALLAVQRACEPRDVVVSTTGYTSRELYACEDRPNQLYVVGSMGCASSVALGLALAQPERRVIVLDGDGAMLMRMGALATIGFERPPNLVHVLLDNEAHESTGGQPTVTSAMDLPAIARACGYPRVVRALRASELEACLRDRAPGLRFVHMKTRPGVPSELPRPRVTPREVAERLRALLREERAA